MSPTSEELDRGGGFQVGMPSAAPITRQLLWINGIAFVAILLLKRFVPAVGDPAWDWLSLNTQVWSEGVPALWQLVTYGFLHDYSDPFHLLFNLLALYFFGSMLEGLVGSRRFLWQYLVALAFGALVHLALVPLVHVDGAPWTQVVGASGAVLYVVVACATLRPDARVLFIFVPMTLKVMALILVGLDLFKVISGGATTTAADVHLAGAALGFAAVRRRWVYFDPQAWWQARRRASEVQAERSDQARLDQLLERIHREGIHSLSQRDRDFLSRMSKRG